MDIGRFERVLEVEPIVLPEPLAQPAPPEPIPQTVPEKEEELVPA